ncbi:MAG TPA: hypothetical protein VN845_06845 [Solirubrobacteraceae bacterium]|nr:hypothetical protein [Solirubrobacteraceae bacterium]
MSSPGLSERLLTERHTLAAQVESQRAQVDRLQGIIDALQERLAHDEHLLDELDGVLGTAAQLQIDSLDARLHGRRLEEVAIQVLREDLGDHVEVHYRDWFELIRARGHRVRGKEPLGTFLAQINRSSAVERVGRRSGRYRLVSVGTPA